MYTEVVKTVSEIWEILKTLSGIVAQMNHAMQFVVVYDNIHIQMKKGIWSYWLWDIKQKTRWTEP